MYTKLIGLGNALPPARVRQVLNAIFKYNFTPNGGLLNGAYPPGKEPRLPTYRDRQGDGNWSGIEYVSAAMMFDQGMIDQGMAVVKAVHQRYLRSGQFFNHQECGPHYYRPMSIWATLLAATGFKPDAPDGILTLAPPFPDPTLRGPWVSATGWGQFTRKPGSFEMDCRDGQTSFRELRVNVPDLAGATLDGQPLACRVTTENGLTVVKFSDLVTLQTRQKLALH
jgi:hypothetical protein